MSSTGVSSMSAEQRLTLIREVEGWAYENTESYYDAMGNGTSPIGADIAYLLGAISRNNSIDVAPNMSLYWLIKAPEESPFPEEALPFVEITKVQP